MRGCSQRLLPGFFVGALTFLGSCGKSPLPLTPLAPDIVATVGARSISISVLTNECARRNVAGHPAEARTILEELIRSEMLLEKAKASGYDRDPEMVRQFERFIANRFREDQLEPQLAKAGSVSEPEIAAYHQREATNYTIPEAVRAAVLFLKVSSRAEASQRQQAQQEAAEILREAQQTDAAGFARLVQARSDDQATRYLGGDGGWLVRSATSSRWPTEVVSAAFALSATNPCAPLISTPAGFYLVRLIERRPEQLRPLSEVREAIAYRLAREKRAQAEAKFFEALKAGLHIQINQTVLDRIQVPSSQNNPVPPPLPGG